MTCIGVVDCGMGNLHSVLAGIQRAVPNQSTSLVTTAKQIDQSDIIIFPGDGHFGACINQIDKLGLRLSLTTAAKTKPFLGICVGMQVLFKSSDEAPDAEGLGVFPSNICRFPEKPSYKVPHMGWNKTQHYQDHSVTNAITQGQYFYFIHSYYAPIGHWTLMKTSYATDFSAIIGQDRLVATQFHPEKSGSAGIALLQQFLNLNYA